VSVRMQNIFSADNSENIDRARANT
jgi:hypothetical protein